MRNDLEADKGKSQGEKNKMLELLQKFEEQQRELEEIERAEKEDDEEDQSPEAVARRREREELEKRLEGVDLDAVEPEQLLSYLSPAQQAAFEATLQDPTRVSKLVEDEFEGDEPWWVEEQELRMLKELREASKKAAQEGGAPTDAFADSDDDEDDEHGVRPPVLLPEQLPPLKTGPDGRLIVSTKLVHNVVAVLFAYSFTLRTFSLTSFASLPEKSTERITAIQVLADLLPFLVERSTSAFASLDDAVEYVVAREGQGMPPPLIALLLRDVATLLRPAPISAISPASSSPLASHALAPVLHAVSDLHHLFSTALASASSSAKSGSTANGPTVSRPLIARPRTTLPLSKSQRQQCTLASAKLVFYTAFLAAPAAAEGGLVSACGVIAEQAEKEAGAREGEEERREEAVERTREELERRKEGRDEHPAVKRGEEPSGPKIVELT
ncbi:hypothetical protein Rhopal_003212-T1 [Rhodotorula paludigena]|uniref:Uncharacterized protein n=1 Tax=Rhodotorula paludigena TaxID=86838 RepID=A0AAV5GIZ5_9BASI|nr:hypothetical protein Rhopal_003212-T1 [Rhodotorula paludigena]